MMKSLASTIASAILVLSMENAAARNIDDAAWREDITAAADHIVANHPAPFHNVSKEEFDHQVATLIAETPQLEDKDIALRLAAIVASLADGHSRLSLPREHPELSFLQGHTGPDAAPNEALFFSTLPFRFFLFEEGLHIVEATVEYEEYIGAKVIKIGEMAVEDAVERVTPILFAENEMGVKLLAADRLALPQVLRHFGIVDDEDRISLTLEQGGETKVINVAPLGAEDLLNIVSAEVRPAIFSPIASGVKKIHHRIPGERAWYIRVDEIEAFPELILADFMAEALRAAKRARAQRVILDLRRNQGGTSSFNPAIINSLAQSDFNAVGKLYVLVGRETFSAATMLVNSFEQYANAVLVGEPSAGRPSHYGDPRRLVLPNSGLTLRSSTLYWQSWLAGDFRDYVDTHVDAAPMAIDYFNGEDAAIEAALSYEAPKGVANQMAALFDQGKMQSGLLRFLGWLNAPTKDGHDAVADLVAHGHRYFDEGELRKGRFMMVMARDYYGGNADAHAGLGRSMELHDEPELAKARYEHALTLDPDNAVALAGLARLAEK